MGGNSSQLLKPFRPCATPTVGSALYGGGIAEESEPSGLNLLEYWRILYKRKWLILGIAVAFVVLAAVRTLMQTPIYTSTVRLQIDPPSKVVEGGNVGEDFSDYEFMQTQYQLLESRTMAERVASALKLEDAVGGISVNPIDETRAWSISATPIPTRRGRSRSPTPMLTPS